MAKDEAGAAAAMNDHILRSWRHRRPNRRRGKAAAGLSIVILRRRSSPASSLQPGNILRGNIFHGAR